MKRSLISFDKDVPRRPVSVAGDYGKSGNTKSKNETFEHLRQQRGSNAGRISVMQQRFSNAPVGASTGQGVSHGEPEFAELQNGWQMKSEKVLDRVASLFNCGTMADVVFVCHKHEIPAHKFILASASPVFYSRFFEKTRTNSRRTTQFGGMQRNGRTLIQIDDVPANAFFEFMRFIYTDKMHVTVDNVYELLTLANDYKVAGLTEVCMEFLSAKTSDPSAVLRILLIIRKSLLKCVVCLWRDLTEAYQLHRSSGEKESESTASTRASSRMSNMGGNSNSMGGSTTLAPISQNRKQAGMGRGSPDGIDHVAEFELSQESRIMSYKIGQVVQELEVLCWRCVEKETEQVLASDAFRDQEKNVLRSILERHCSTVPEIALFRAVNRWVEYQCVKKHVNPTIENKKRFLGKEATQLLRFPAMSTEQLQREVVPTGLLDYEDVHSLLRYKDGGSALTRFSATSREGFDQQDLPTARRPSQEPLRPFQKVYEPDANDHIDQLLAAGLLRQHLRGPSSTPLEANRNPYVKSVLLRGYDEMKHKDLTKKALGEENAPKAEDFQRISPGLYRFRNKQMLRISIEGGTVMVYQIQDYLPDDIEDAGHFGEDTLEYVRRTSKVKSWVLQHGIPLASFLEGD